MVLCSLQGEKAQQAPSPSPPQSHLSFGVPPRQKPLTFMEFLGLESNSPPSNLLDHPTSPPALSRGPSFHRAVSPPDPLVSSPREIRPIVTLPSVPTLSSSPPSSGSLSPRPRNSMLFNSTNHRSRLPPKQTSVAHFFSSSSYSLSPALSSSLPKESPCPSSLSSSVCPPSENQRPYLAPRQQSFSSFTNYNVFFSFSHSHLSFLVLLNFLPQAELARKNFTKEIRRENKQNNSVKKQHKRHSERKQY